jgi:hypothetical protein
MVVVENLVVAVILGVVKRRELKAVVRLLYKVLRLRKDFMACRLPALWTRTYTLLLQLRAETLFASGAHVASRLVVE